MEAHGIDSKPFGSGDPRFLNGFFAVKEGPGPADYDLAKEQGQPQERLQSKKIGFSATSERFNVKSAGILYNYIDKSNKKQDLFLGDLRKREDKYEKMNKTNIGFKSTQSRFRYHKKQIITPGPGHYDADDIEFHRKIKPNKAFNTTEEKFTTQLNSYLKISSTGNNVGPGSYVSESNVI